MLEYTIEAHLTVSQVNHSSFENPFPTLWGVAPE